MVNKENSIFIKNLSILDTILLLIIFISLSGVALLCFGVFKSIYAILAGALIFAIVAIIFKFKITFEKPRLNFIIIFIFLVAILFRIGAYLHVYGGQDQGIYVNMSSYYENHGSTIIEDNNRKTLSEEEKTFYDANNQTSIFNVRDGKYDGHHMPGIYISNLEKSQYVFQFYPLHPMWMSISGYIFGEDNRVLSLLFFSLLTIYIFGLIAFELSNKNKTASYIVMLLLAVNPMYVFFAKFPVSEIVTVFFSSAGLYLLIKYYRSIQNSNINSFFYLAISAGLFSCLFFNHISGFMYIPMFYVFMLFSIILIKNKLIRKQILTYNILIFLGFALSVLYGLKFSYPYVHDVYIYAFKRYLGDKWFLILLFSIVLMIIIVLLSILFKKYLNKFFNFIINHFNKIMLITISIASLIAIYKSYQLSFTSKFIGDSWLDTRWHLANGGILSLANCNIFNLAVYLSPFGFLALVIAIFIYRKNKDILFSGVLFFVCVFFIIRITFGFSTPYFYYSRYLVSEVIPYSILIISLLLADLWIKDKGKKVISIIFVLLISVSSVFITSFQFVGKELGEVHVALKRVQQNVDNMDLLLLSKDEIPIQIKTPLDYYYNLNTLYYDKLQNINSYSSLLYKFNDVFILTNTQINELNNNLEDTININFQRYRASIVPLIMREQQLNYYLYKVDKDNIKNFKNIFKYKFGSIIDFSLNGNSSMYKGKGWSSVEREMTWTEGNNTMLNVLTESTKNDLELIATIAPLAKQRVNIKVNGKYIGKWSIEESKYKDYSIVISNNLITDSIINIEFELPDAVSPSEVINGSNDKRKLALSFKNIIIKEKIE